MLAPATPAATRIGERKAEGGTTKETSELWTAPQAVARIGKSNAPLGYPIGPIRNLLVVSKGGRHTPYLIDREEVATVAER